MLRDGLLVGLEAGEAIAADAIEDGVEGVD